MAAYAAVVSLMNTVEQVQHHPHHSTSLDKKQTESLGEKVGFLEGFIEKYSHVNSTETEALEREITSAAHAAEDVVESHIVDQIEAGSVSFLDLQKVIDDIDFVKEKVMKLQEEMGFQEPRPAFTTPFTSSTPFISTGKSKMVGCDDELIQLMDMLTGHQSNRQIIPINGMGGIGKTTLARSAYETSLIVQHFDIRAWVTISQQYSVDEILLQLLSCQEKYTSELDNVSEDQLEVRLHKYLSGRRYLIILDDMWSVEAWDKIKFFFPDNGNRSRIVVTTREINVANHFGSVSLAKRFLDEDKSWHLFCDKVFAHEDCPPELEKIGRKIVVKCKGLPLSIVVIGGLLRKSAREHERWENVANNINSVLISGEDEHCFKILSFSYNHLPAHLKPCFLYIGIFPEDSDISVSELMRLWVAEGFLKRSNKTQNLEETAEDYLKDLIDRNLILVRKLGSNGKIKTCYIHDLLRDLCSRIAMKQKFLCEVRALDIPRGIHQERRIVFTDNSPQLASLLTCDAFLARSLILETLVSERLVYYGDHLSSKFRLLRVLNVVGRGNIAAIFCQFNLRYLAFRFFLKNGELPLSISRLWNVQTLISRKGLGSRTIAPSTIWEMPQLRHIEFDVICLPDPPSNHDQQGGSFVLRNLQTLSRVQNFKLSEEVCKRTPNLKKLRVFYGDLSRSSFSDYCLHNLGSLHALESLSCIFTGFPGSDFLQNVVFPSSLRKLSLRHCRLHWEDLSIIGSLPHLEVLKLNENAVTGNIWNPVEGEFLCLRFLKIYMCRDLTYWNADSSHFPVLENLVIGRLSKLEEIPFGIGDIPTLKLINVVCCNEAAAISAIKILEEQDSCGNEDLQVRLMFITKGDKEKFMEKVEVIPESSSTNNCLQIECYGDE